MPFNINTDSSVSHMVYLKVQKYTDFEIKCNMKLILRRRRFEQMCISFMANTMWNVPHTDLTGISVFYCKYVKCTGFISTCALKAVYTIWLIHSLTPTPTSPFFNAKGLSS